MDSSSSTSDVDLGAVRARLALLPAEHRAAFLESLPTDLLLRYHEADWRVDPASMSSHLDPSFVAYRYIRYLAGKYRDAVEGRSKRQIWSVPPRYGKTHIASIRGPAWTFDRYPRANIILASYGDALAYENAIAVRDFLDEHADSLRVTLRRDRKRMDRFVTSENGGLLAAGMNSAITGFGAGAGGGIVVDDPFKGWQDAHSPHARDVVWNQYRAVLRSRLDDPDAWIIVVHTRWHTDDLTGRLLDAAQNGTGEEFETVVLREIAEDDDPLGRAPGEPLEPRRFDLEQIAATHLAAGSYLTSALYQQHPSPEEGTELLREWWRLGDPPARMDEWCSSWDMKLKEKESGDYVVGQVWGRVGSDYWLVEQIRGQWDQATTRVGMALLAVRWPECRRHLVENAGYGPEVMAEIRKPSRGWECDGAMAGRLGIVEHERPLVEEIVRRGLDGTIPIKPKGSKVVRARAVIPLLEAGNVHLNARASWLPGYLDEAAQFPNGDHDDQVDAFSQAVSRLSGRGKPATATSPAAMRIPTIA